MINASTFCTPDLEENKFHNEPITKLEMLALAIAAQRINGGYYKRGGHSDFVNKIETVKKCNALNVLSNLIALLWKLFSK